MNEYTKDKPYYKVDESKFPKRTPAENLAMLRKAQNFSNKTLAYSTEKRKASDNDYLKVFLADDSQLENVQRALNGLSCVRQVNITESPTSGERTLTVYPKKPFSIEQVEDTVKACLNGYTSGVVTNDVAIDTEAHFKAQESKIINAIQNAGSSIDVCMAWFTNDTIQKALVDALKKGIKIRIIIYEDGVNQKNGVDLSLFDHKEMRGERGGIMHDKYCVVDNWTVLTGSYNWTKAAETRNDENVQITENDKDLANSYTRRFNEQWERAKA